MLPRTLLIILLTSFGLSSVLTVSGCGASRVEGDADGVLVPFAVQVDEAFFSRMADHRTSVGTGAGVGFGSGGSTGLGLGFGLGFHATTVYLLGGEHPGEAGSFRRKLSWGENHFVIPLRAGRTVNLTVQAEGGRQGWESVGVLTVAVPAADQVDLKLDRNGVVSTIH